jgi:hypothetical protein
MEKHGVLSHVLERRESYLRGVGGGNDTTGAWMRSGLHNNYEKSRFGTAIHTYGGQVGSYWCLRACRHVTARSHRGQLVQKSESGNAME